jgi:hypothetical protein
LDTGFKRDGYGRFTDDLAADFRINRVKRIIYRLRNVKRLVTVRDRIVFE